MIGSDSEDFPLNGGKSKLARLFEGGGSDDNTSLKYTPSKEQKMKPTTSKPTKSPLHMKVCIGKTVEAFKIENGKYKCHGKVGIAILGNEEQLHYQLYMYNTNEKKISSVDVSTTFHFKVHKNEYASFHDRNRDAWSVRFDQSQDLADFCKELALARFRVSDATPRKIVQDIVYGDDRNVVKNTDVVTAKYKIFALSEDKQLSKEITRRSQSNTANFINWEVEVIGTFLNSVRIVIIPQNNLGLWEIVLPQGYSVWLEMEIHKISSSVTEKKTENTSHVLPSVRRKKSADPPITTKEALVSRMAKMGQPLVPFPGFPSRESDSEPEVEGPDHGDSSSTSSSIPEVEMKNTIQLPSKRPELSVQPIKPSQQVFKEYSQEPILESRLSLTSEEPKIYQHELAITAQFNVLFSELRTSNAELRMNLTRLTDKVENLSLRVDTKDGSANRSTLLATQMDHLMQSQNDLNAFVIDKFKQLYQQNNDILSVLTERNNSSNLQANDSTQFELKEAKRKNRELEKFLIDANDKSNELQAQINELKEHLRLSEKQKEIMERVHESERQPCLNCGEFKALQSCVNTLESRNCNLETAKLELENKNLNLEIKLNNLLQKENESEKQFVKEKQEKLKRIKELEIELKSIKTSSHNKTSDKVNNSERMSNIVKQVMNLTYKSLKSQLAKEDSDAANKLNDSLPNTLRAVASAYLAQASENFVDSPKGVETPRSGWSSSEEDVAKERASVITCGNPPSFSLDSPLPSTPPVRPRKETVKPPVRPRSEPQKKSVEDNNPHEVSEEKSSEDVALKPDLEPFKTTSTEEADASKPIIKPRPPALVTNSEDNQTSPESANETSSSSDNTYSMVSQPVSTRKPFVKPRTEVNSKSDMLTHPLAQVLSPETSIKTEDSEEVTSEVLSKSDNNTTISNDTQSSLKTDFLEESKCDSPLKVSCETKESPVSNEISSDPLKPDEFFYTAFEPPPLTHFQEDASSLDSFTDPFSQDDPQESGSNKKPDKEKTLAAEPTDFSYPNNLHYNFVPMIKSEPPPLPVSPTPSPPNDSVTAGSTLGLITDLKSDDEGKRKKGFEPKVSNLLWQPPPLLDDDSDDEWRLKP